MPNLTDKTWKKRDASRTWVHDTAERFGHLACSFFFLNNRHLACSSTQISHHRPVSLLQLQQNFGLFFFSHSHARLKY